MLRSTKYRTAAMQLTLRNKSPQTSHRTLGPGAFGVSVFLALVAMLSAVAVSSAIAESPGDSMTEVIAAGQQVFGVLQDYRAPVQMRRQLLHRFIHDRFDFERVALSALGPHWQAMPPPHR